MAMLKEEIKFANEDSLDRISEQIAHDLSVADISLFRTDMSPNY